MNFNELSNSAGDVCCPYCGSREIIRKGFRKRKEDIGRIGFCKNCSKYFTYPQKRIRRNVASEEILLQYIKGKPLSEFGYPKSTLHRQILRRINSFPSWEEATGEWLDQLRDQEWFKNLVVDTTVVKVGGEKRIYLHAADNYFKRPLIYKVIERENKEYIARELRKLKSLGYCPDIVTVDLAPELLSAIKEVYKWAKIQGCLFHLARFLNKNLKKTEGTPEDVALAREKAKNLILHSVCADFLTRRSMIQKLAPMLQPSVDEKTKQVIRIFLNRYIKFYHTLEELNGHAETLTTNLCERHIGLVKKFKRRLCGFKSFNTAQKLLNSYWFFYIKEKRDIVKKDLNVRRFEGAAAFLLDGHISVSRLSHLLGLPEQYLVETAKKKGKIMILGYPISRRQIRRILQLAPKVNTVGELSEIMALNPRVVCKILTIYGFNVKVQNPQMTIDEIFNHQSNACSRIDNARIIKP